MRIVVVGGGIAGLAAAHRLRERAGDAVEIVIVERSDQLGGKLRTGTFAGQAVETGAETFLVSEHGAASAVLELAHRVGLGPDLVHPAPVPAAIAVGHQLRLIPARTLLGVPSDLSTLDGLAQATDSDHDSGQALLTPGADVAVGELVRRRFGDDVVDRLVDPMLGGVYAGRADTLSLAATMPGLHWAAQHQPTLLAAVRAALAAAPRPAGTPIFATIRGGLSRLVTAVVDAAAAQVRLGATVREIARTGEGWQVVVGSTRDPESIMADALVLAVPARPAARLLAPIDAAASAAVGVLDYASLALVTLALPADTTLPELSGFLVPATEGYTVKASTFFTTKWPHLRVADGPVLVRASLGRYGQEAELQRPDADLVTRVCGDLAALLGQDLPTPVASMVTRWGGALPQYGVGHVDRVTSARARLGHAQPTLALTGAAYDGVGIAACVRSGLAAAEAIWSVLEQSRS